MAEQNTPSELLSLITEIVAAHVTNNALPLQDLPRLINDVYKTLSNIGNSFLQAAVPIKQSVTPDYIVCLEDGKKLKMLKRHLKTAYNMTPEEYRERWQLPASYPMVAPSYTQHRSMLAKKIGLGTHKKQKKTSGQ